jgi:hypothetical protein
MYNSLKQIASNVGQKNISCVANMRCEEKEMAWRNVSLEVTLSSAAE